MKRFILFLSFFSIFHILCHAKEYNQNDSTKVEYRVYGCDTLITQKFKNLHSCGLKQYFNDILVNFKDTHPDFINSAVNTYLGEQALNIINDVFDGYGKERCKEMVTIFEKTQSAFMFFVRIRINIEGKITCVEFMYIPELSQFMTYEDIKRNTQIIINRKPTPFLAEYDIELSPWITIPVIKKVVNKYLEDVTKEI